MSERKWTPGPWVLYEVDGITHWPGINCGATSLVVWGNEMENCGVQGNSLDEARANAHLIAAAPDLYEALEDLAADMIVHMDDLTIAVVHNALAKARGEARGETQ